MNLLRKEDPIIKTWSQEGSKAKTQIVLDFDDLDEDELSAVGDVIFFEARMPPPHVSGKQMSSIHWACCKMGWMRSYRELLSYYTKSDPSVYIHTGEIPELL